MTVGAWVVLRGGSYRQSGKMRSRPASIALILRLRPLLVARAELRGKVGKPVPVEPEDIRRLATERERLCGHPL